MNHLFVLPATSPPANGWPLIVTLHGYGAGPGEFADVAEHCAAQGFAALSIAGPTALAEQSFHWSFEGVEETHRHIQSALTEAAGERAIDRVSLMGFSQGATHSVHLLIAHSDCYAGAIAFSPGQSLPLPAKAPGESRPLAICFGEYDLPTVPEAVEAMEQLWRGANFPIRVTRHAGGHALPDDWAAYVTEALKWMA